MIDGPEPELLKKDVAVVTKRQNHKEHGTQHPFCPSQPVDTPERLDGKPVLTQGTPDAALREESKMRPVHDPLVTIDPLLAKQQLTQAVVIAHIGNGGDEITAVLQLAADRIEKRVMIGHVFDDIVADRQVKIAVRQILLYRLRSANQHTVKPLAGDSGGRCVHLDAPDLTTGAQAAGKTTLATPDLQHLCVAGRQKLRHFRSLSMMVSAVFHGVPPEFAAARSSP